MRDIVKISEILNLNDYDVDQLVNNRRVQLKELENKQITVLSIDTYKNIQHNKAGIKARILVDNEEKVLMTTSFIIVKQLLEIKSNCSINNIELPSIQCTVVREKGYFKLV